MQNKADCLKVQTTNPKEKKKSTQTPIQILYRNYQKQKKKKETKGRQTISSAQAVGNAASRLPPKSSQAATHITGGARLAPLAKTEYRMAS